MTRATSWARRAAAFAFVFGCGATAWLSTATTADAASSGAVEINLPAHHTGFTSSPFGALLDLSGLVPGDSASGVMGVRNDSDDPASLTLSSVHITSAENGCAVEELTAPGGCAPGSGQLGDHLVFALAVASHQHGIYHTSWTGSAAELQSGVQVRTDVGAGHAVWVRMTAALPRSAGNEVQSDRYGFDLRVTLTGSAGAASEGVHGSPGVGGGGLADTGTTIALIAGAGLLLIASGMPLAVAARASRRRRVLLA